MAPGKPEHSYSRTRSDTLKTPAGVWVIVGMAALFVVGAFSVSVFVIWRAVAEKRSLSFATPERSIVNERQVLPPETKIEEPVSRDVVAEPVSDQRERDETRREVLKRIDLMKSLSDRDKDQLYAQVEKARGFIKIATISFPQSSVAPGAAQTVEMIKRLQAPELRELLDDPTAVLVIIGYADLQGGEEKNRAISRARAENVVKELREKTTFSNVMHPVAMGGQSFLDTTKAERNRLVEVWIAQP
jgi:outer membrane protein OmpA-like peptidoglycan-associated protein